MIRRRPLNASLGCLTLIAVFFLAASFFGLAYQAKPSYKIDVGSRLDEPFVSGFQPKEPGYKARDKDWDGFDYRWAFTSADNAATIDSKIDLVGLGSQPLTVTLRVSPGSNPSPSLKVIVNEKNQVPAQYLKLPASENLFELSFPVPPDWFPDGNLHLKLQSAAWTPAQVVPGSSDRRRLGILLDWVKVEPAQQSFFPLVRPPDDIFIPLVISSLLVLLMFLSIGLSPLYALLLCAGVFGAVSYWLIFDRLDLTELISKDFVRSVFFIWVAVYIVAELGPKVFGWLGQKVTRRESGWLAGIFLFQFVMLWGFMLHPEFTSSDLGLNIHLLQSAQSGNFLFPQKLPNGQLAPYPPAYYIGLLPFTNFVGKDDADLGTLIKVASSLLQATEVFFIFYLSTLLRKGVGGQGSGAGNSKPHPSSLLPHPSRDWEEGTNWAGILAAAFYTVCKYPYYIFSQGNHSNLFGVWALLLFLCVTTGTLSYLRGVHGAKIQPLPASQPRSTPQPKMIAASRLNYNPASVIILEEPQFEEEYEEEAESPSLSQRYFNRLLERWQKQVWPILAVTLRYLLPLALLVLVFTAHYGTFLFTNLLMISYVLIMGLFGGRVGRRDALYLLMCYVSALLIAFLLYYGQDKIFKLLGSAGSGKASKTIGPDLAGNLLLWLWRDAVYQFGLIVVLAAIVGTLLRLIRPGWKQIFRQISPVGAGLLALILTTGIFLTLDFVIGLESRFQLYLLPLVVIAAGAFFGRVWRTGWAGMLLVSAVFIFQFVEVLTFWLDRVTYYF